VLGVVENMSTLHIALDSLRFMATPAAAASSGGDKPRQQQQQQEQQDLTAAVRAALQAALVDSGLVRSLGDVAAAADVFLPTGGGAAAMCAQLGLQLLGKVPLDPLLGQAAEEGRAVGPAANGTAGGHEEQHAVPPSAAALQAIVKRILQQVDAAPAVIDQ
jgi:hypothetical protein